MIKLEYPFTFLNEYIQQERTNKYRSANIKKDTTYAISLMLNGQPKIPTPCGLSFIWTIPNKSRDLDNISFACKYILDGMVKAGVIENDNLKHITSLHHEFKIGDKVGVEINVI